MCATALCDSLPSHDLVGGGGRGPMPLLIVDDDVAMRRTLTYYFRARGYVAYEAGTLADAKSAFAAAAGWALVVADNTLPDGTGWELCCWIRACARPAPPFLLISGSPGASALAGEVDFLAKPFSVDELTRRVGVLMGRPDGRACG